MLRAILYKTYAPPKQRKRKLSFDIADELNSENNDNDNNQSKMKKEILPSIQRRMLRTSVKPRKVAGQRIDVSLDFLTWTEDNGLE